MKIRSTLIAILALLLAMPLAAENYSGKCGADLNWTLDTETGVLDITGSGDMYNASIAMDISWYSYRNNITSVNLPNGLTSIGSYAFYGCEKLTNVDIPNTVSVLGFQAFCNCSSLSTITIPDGLIYINVSAFSGCSSLTSLTLPKSVTKIFDSAFCFCSNITSFTFGDAVTYIGPNAFQDCSGLDSLVLPASITEIRNNAFSGCTGLTSITCHATNPPAVNYYDSDKKTGGVFYQVNKSIPLYVPEESIEAYQTTEQWKDFTNIQAIPKEPTPKPVYLVPDRWATDDGDKFAVWGWKGTEASGWSAFMTLTDDGRAYQAEINEQYTDFYISRFASSVEEPEASVSLDQTKNVTYDADKPVCYTTDSEYVYYTRKYSVEQHTLPFWYVSFVDYDGTELKKQVVDDNATPSAPSAPSHEGLTFTGWDKEIVAATADATYKATYSVAPGYYTLTVKPNIADWGNVDGSGVYKNGATAMITAVPASGYQFSKWSDGSNENPREVVVSQDSIITAIFIDPNAKTIYLNTTGWWWDKDSYYVSSWKDNNVPTLVKMTKVFDYIYKADINKEHTHVIYYDATSSSLEEVKDRTETLIIPENEDLFKITLPTTGTYNDSSWGYWSVYDEEKYALYYDYGSCGENVIFTAGRDSLLTISGNGEMNDYLASDEGIAGWTPWVTWYYDSISLPEGLTKIGTYAFDWARAKNITIPSTVSTIGSGALNGSIKSIVCKSVTPPAIKEVKDYRTQEPYHFFSGSDFSIPVYVPASSVAAYKSADYWKDFTNIQAIDGSGEGGGEGGGPEPGMRAIYLVTSPSYWYNDQDYYIQSWQYESNPTTVKMDYVADYLYRAYIDENHTTAYFFYLGKGESYTSIDNVWEGDKTKTTIPSDKDMYILTSSYMGVWSALEYGEWGKYDAEKSIQNFVYGTTGEVEYAVHRDSTFIITGAGSMEHYETNRSEENPLPYWPQWDGGWSSYVTSVSLPEGLTVIGAYSLSFYKVKSVTIPSTVSVIGSGAFYAKNYTSITCKAVTPPTITARTTTEDLQHFFRDVDFSIPLYVPAASVSTYQSADYWKEFTNIQAIDGSGEPSQEERTVTLKVNNAEWGTVSGGGRFYNGDTITITAIPNDGYVFVSWSNGDTNAQTQFVVGGDVVIIAQFAPLPQAEPIALNMNAVEIDYYPSYNSDKGYDYFLILYTYEDNAFKAAPLVAFDIYTAAHKDFAGEYNLSKENLEVQYGAARIPSTSDGGYDEYDLSDAAVTITINADNSYTLTGYITVSTGQVYNFEVTDNPYYCDVEHENEPETPKTLNLTMVSGEINMQYIDKGKIYLNFLTADSCKVVLSFGTADSTAVDIKDGTYSITQNTKETFWAGRSYNSNVYYSYAAFGDDRYYLTSGSVTITTITTGRFISVNASSYYGSQFKFTYLIENPAEQKYSIFVFANDSRLGTVTGGGQYVAGTQVTLTATPANGSRFEKWSNGSTENTLTITVTSEATYVAMFKAVVSSTADETDGYNQYDVKDGVVEPWTNESGHLPQNTDIIEDIITSETPPVVSVRKIIYDGHLYIQRAVDEHVQIFSTQGARVK